MSCRRVQFGNFGGAAATPSREGCAMLGTVVRGWQPPLRLERPVRFADEFGIHIAAVSYRGYNRA